MKKFSDISRESQNLPGKKINIADVFGKAIELLAFRTVPSKVAPGKNCAQIQFQLDGELFVAFTTSAVIMRQLVDYESELPFETVLRKQGRYHTLS